jgi:hypothetical protein
LPQTLVSTPDCAMTLPTWTSARIWNSSHSISSFWRMSAARRLSQRFYKSYFCLLMSSKNRRVEARSVARWLLHRYPENGLQFSFATKLVHMADPSLPVYDSIVRAFFFLPERNGQKRKERMRRLLGLRLSEERVKVFIFFDWPKRSASFIESFSIEAVRFWTRHN